MHHHSEGAGTLSCSLASLKVPAPHSVFFCCCCGQGWKSHIFLCCLVGIRHISTQSFFVFLFFHFAGPLGREGRLLFVLFMTVSVISKLLAYLSLRLRYLKQKEIPKNQQNVVLQMSSSLVNLPFFPHLSLLASYITQRVFSCLQHEKWREVCVCHLSGRASLVTDF